MDASPDSVKRSVDLPTTDCHDSTGQPSISFVLPAYNEQEVIAQAIREADTGLATITTDYEVLVVDDGSSDNTRQIAEQEAAHRPAVRVISLPKNAGYGAALRTGFQAAEKAWIGFTDADCQFDIRELNRLVLLLHSYDIACGYRIDRQDHWLRLLYSRVYNFLVRILLGTGVRDVDCAFKLFRRETLRAIQHETDGFLINSELLTKARIQGRTVAEVGVTHRPRADGESTVSAWHTIPVIQALLRFWWSRVMFPANQTVAGHRPTVWSHSRVALGVVSLCLLSLLMFLGNLSYPLIEPDESRYAQIALEMVQSGNYLVPRLAGEPYLDKPPLLYWTTAACFKWLGTDEFAARVPSAVAAWFTVLVTFLLGRRLVGDRTAYLGSLMLFLCLGFVLAARFLIMDGLLTLFTTLAILAAFLATREVRIRLGWWLVAAVACGLGFMTKGPIAIVLILPPLIAVQWLTPDRPRLKIGHWLLFGFVVLLITAPWFILIGRHQGDFVTHFLWKHHVVRFVSAFNHREPFWYYIPVILLGMFPASLLAAPVAAFLTSRSERFRSYRTVQLGSVLLAAVWVVAFFSLSKCKLPTYILPALPLLCLVQATMVGLILDSKWSVLPLPSLMHRIPRHATSTVLAVGGVLATIDLALVPDQGFRQTLNLSIIALAIVIVIHRLTVRQRRAAAPSDWLLAATVSLLVMFFGFQQFMPELARFRSINANAAKLRVNGDASELPVVYFAHPCAGSLFHLNPKNVLRYEEEELEAFKQFLQRHPQVVVVADPPEVDKLRTDLADLVELKSIRGARGRVYLSAVRAAPLVGARPTSSLQR